MESRQDEPKKNPLKAIALSGFAERAAAYNILYLGACISRTAPLIRVADVGELFLIHHALVD